MNKYYRKYTTKECKQCGKPYEVREDHKSSQYCSRQCAGLSKRKQPIKCEYCGEEFIPKRKSTQYCSNTCSGASRNVKVTLRCDYCGKQYLKHRCHVTENNFCSRDCYGKWISENKTGENAFRWSGGIYNQADKYKHIKQPDGTYKQEHRIVMEKHLGRELDPTEIVHHVDGNGKNNSIGNLQLMTRAEHARYHTTERWNNETFKEEAKQ